MEVLIILALVIFAGWAVVFAIIVTAKRLEDRRRDRDDSNAAGLR